MTISLEHKTLFKPKEVAIRFFGNFNDTNRKKIYRWIQQGKIKVVKDNRNYYIPKNEIEKVEAHLDAVIDSKVGS